MAHLWWWTLLDLVMSTGSSVGFEKCWQSPEGVNLLTYGRGVQFEANSWTDHDSSSYPGKFRKTLPSTEIGKPKEQSASRGEKTPHRAAER